MTLEMLERAEAYADRYVRQSKPRVAVEIDVFTPDDLRAVIVTMPSVPVCPHCGKVIRLTPR